MTRIQPQLPATQLLAFGLVNLPLSMLMSPTAAVLPNFYLEYMGSPTPSSAISPTARGVASPG